MEKFSNKMDFYWIFCDRKYISLNYLITLYLFEKYGFFLFIFRIQKKYYKLSNISLIIII